MDRLRELEVFVAVADTGSFSRAGGRLRLSPPAVTRAIAALEERLGARVFQRTTRSLAITETGRSFLERARRILADLEEAEKEAIGEAAAPQGPLVVTASVTMGRSMVGAIVGDFLREHPRVTASLLLLDRVVHLVDEGIDVAVRVGDMADSGLVARRVGAVRRVLVGSPAYLARRGVPASPADLKAHAFIGFTGLMPGREIRFGTARETTSVTIRPALEVNDALTAIDAAKAGLGLTMALSYMVHDDVSEGRLAMVLADRMPPPRPVHLVHAGAWLPAPNVRAFLDFAAPRLRQRLAAVSGTEADESGN
jgi:DNA-binding transcriptional LysR family regulator